jgi:hypothetical protein
MAKKIFLSNGADPKSFGALGLPVSWPVLIGLSAAVYFLFIRRRK